MVTEHPAWNELLDSRLPYRRVEVIWAVRQEMARSVEDVLARRTRALLLDARASMDCAPAVAALIAEELGQGEQWQSAQIESYNALARNYLPA
jgi:glycerol-3-phosphate dehydrogenase